MLTHDPRHLNPERAPTRQIRAAIYVRVSSVGQDKKAKARAADDEREVGSLETQEAACRAYAAERGYTVVGLYRETFTGYELYERPQLGELREAARRRDFDVLIVYAVDRLSRKQSHQFILLEVFEQAGVAVEFVTERFEDTAVGRFMLSA